MASFNFSNKTLSAFLNELASPSVTPGGGSAAAVTAALGAALLEMTAGINQNKNPGQPAAKNLKKIKKIRISLLKLASEDANAFFKFSKIRKKDKQSGVYQNSLKQNVQVPFKICRACCEGLKIASGEISRTSQWLASDLAESALLLESAFRAGRWNVEINLRGARDARYVGRMKADLRTMGSECLKKKRLILKGLKYR